MYDSYDTDTFERDWMTRNMSYTYDFEIDKNLFHNQSVLIYGHPQNWNSESSFT